MGRSGGERSLAPGTHSVLILLANFEDGGEASILHLVAYAYIIIKERKRQETPSAHMMLKSLNDLYLAFLNRCREFFPFFHVLACKRSQRWTWVTWPKSRTRRRGSRHVTASEIDSTWRGPRGLLADQSGIVWQIKCLAGVLLGFVLEARGSSEDEDDLTRLRIKMLSVVRSKNYWDTSSAKLGLRGRRREEGRGCWQLGAIHGEEVFTFPNFLSWSDVVSLWAYRDHPKFLRMDSSWVIAIALSTWGWRCRHK